jgi:hypothetical protein
MLPKKTKKEFQERRENLVEFHSDDDLKELAFKFKEYLYRRVGGKEEIEKMVQEILLDYKKEFQAVAAMVAKMKVGRILRSVDALDMLEKDLLNPNNLFRMTTDSKIRLLSALSKSIDSDLETLTRHTQEETKVVDAALPVLRSESVPTLDPHQRRRVSQKVLTIIRSTSEGEEDDDDEQDDKVDES